MQTTLDRFGRLVLPKSIREHLGLRPGTVLQVEQAGSDVLLKPAVPGPRIERRGGMPVIVGVTVAEQDVRDAVNQDREDRIRHITRSR
jgi:AbrB family looped-hinge helix DNA binding protein